jgi:hypothetical protein
MYRVVMSFVKICFVKAILCLAVGLNLCLVLLHSLSDFCEIQYKWSEENDVESW